MILEYKDIQKKVIDYYRTGGGKTYYVGFKKLAELYSVKEGGVTDWTGYAGSGKTELLFDILKNCSLWYNHKHLIYMPDAGSHEEVIAKLLHKLTGKQFEEFYYNAEGKKIQISNRIKEEEIIKELPWILEHFLIYNPNEKGIPKTVTPKSFWDYAVANKKRLGIFSAVIDSWNYMKHDTNGHSREDKWLEDVLSYRNFLAESSGLHFHTIIHPKTAKKDREGRIIMPDMHSLKGGSEWSNNGKTIIIVHREFKSNITDVKIDKAKPKIVGTQGIACLQYDIKKGAFYEIVDENGGYIKYAERIKPQQLKTN